MQIVFILNLTYEAAVENQKNVIKEVDDIKPDGKKAQLYKYMVADFVDLIL